MASFARVAAAQLGPASATRTQTVLRLARLVTEASEARLDLVVFPELSLTEYFCGVYRSDISGYVESELPSADTRPIFEAVAASTGLSVVLPYAERAGDAVYNSAVLIGPT